MPELPEIEALVRRLRQRLVGQRVVELDVHRHLVLRNLLDTEDLPRALIDRPVMALERRGKYLLIELDGIWLVTNLMLAGNLTWPQPGEPLKSRDYYSLTFSNGIIMRYNDPRSMGKTYVAASLDAVPGMTDMAPDALAPELTCACFLERIKGYPGEIKGVLTHERVVSGIGNAYADEVLFGARIYPFLKNSRLSVPQREELYAAMRSVLEERIAYLLEHWPPEMDLHWREGLMVHRRAGEPCPRCGTPISEINVGKRPTDFCRHCQPGMLIRN